MERNKDIKEFLSVVWEKCGRYYTEEEGVRCPSAIGREGMPGDFNGDYKALYESLADRHERAKYNLAVAVYILEDISKLTKEFLNLLKEEE